MCCWKNQWMCLQKLKECVGRTKECVITKVKECLSNHPRNVLCSARMHCRAILESRLAWITRWLLSDIFTWSEQCRLHKLNSHRQASCPSSSNAALQLKECVVANERMCWISFMCCFKIKNHISRSFPELGLSYANFDVVMYFLFSQDYKVLLQNLWICFGWGSSCVLPKVENYLAILGQPKF